MPFTEAGEMLSKTLNLLVSKYGLVRFSSVQSFDRLGRRGKMKDDSVEIIFQSFLREVIMRSCDMGSVVHSFMLSI